MPKEQERTNGDGSSEHRATHVAPNALLVAIQTLGDGHGELQTGANAKEAADGHVGHTRGASYMVGTPLDEHCGGTAAAAASPLSGTAAGSMYDAWS